MTTTPTPRLGTALSLAEYEILAREFVEERYPKARQMLEHIRLSLFIVWLRHKLEREREQAATQQPPTTNLLTFRIEKERDSEL
jgi:hypothetical protein